MLSFATTEEKFASGYAIASFSLTALLAIFIPVYLYCKRDKLADPEFNGKCGSLILRMNPDRTGIVLFQTFFLVRRLILSILIVFYADKPTT